MNLEKLKYPIGKFEVPKDITDEILQKCIEDIASFPTRLRQVVNNLNESHLNTEYRPGGWTIRQLLNHCADSHMNGFMRVKLTLTEEKPVIKPYLEASWAELEDSRDYPIESALSILDGIHPRWSTLLKSFSLDQWQRTFIHPEQGREITLAANTCLYAWHCNHHLAHITTLKESKGW